MRKILCGLICFVLAMSFGASAESYGGAVGDPLPDFTLQTIDGSTFTLSEALEDRAMVLINLWATWCPPCEMEFPYLEEAYELYQDRVAVVALSVEPNDTPEKLAEYAESHGLTFPIGSDTGIGLGNIFAYEGIPTSLVVDRFGNVAFVETGAQPSTASFIALFEYFLDENYTDTAVIDAIPPIKPNVEPADPATLAEAGNAPGGALAFRNADDTGVWPMLPVELGERSALVSTNNGVDESESTVCVDLIAGEGDALAFDFKVSSETIYDALRVIVDGNIVKSFSGERDWSLWAVPLSAGAHEVRFAYIKDQLTGDGTDSAWIDNVQLISGADAEAALLALPVYPTGDEFSIRPTGDAARWIEFDDPNMHVLTKFGVEGAWVANSPEIDLSITLTGDCDPESAVVFDFDQTLNAVLAELISGDGSGYTLNLPLNGADETGTPFSLLYFLPKYPPKTDEDLIYTLFFRDEDNVDRFVDMMADYGMEFGWHYTENAATNEAQTESTYTVRFEDQDGEPVPGCIVNFCTDDSCQPVQADATGTAVFVGAPFAYHLQVILVPDGYTLAGEAEMYTEAHSQALTFELISE